MANAEITRATIVNWALLELGDRANFSISDTSGLGGKVDLVWPRCEAECFGLHDWSFCRFTKKLVRQAATPENGWAYGFDLPAGMIGPVLKVLDNARDERPLRDFALEGGSLYADCPEIWARVKLALDPRYWDVNFASAFATALAGMLAIPIMQDEKLAGDLHAKAFTGNQMNPGGKFGRLIAQDRAGSPLASPLYAIDPLTQAHGGSSNWYGRG